MAYKYFPTKSSVYIVYSLYHINFGFLTIFCTDARDCLYLKFYKSQTYLLYLINIPKISQLVIERDFMLQKDRNRLNPVLKNEIEDLQQFEI